MDSMVKDPRQKKKQNTLGQRCQQHWQGIAEITVLYIQTEEAWKF